MKDEEQFDHLVKGKLEGRSFEPSEESWAAAEKLIAAQESRLLWKKRLMTFALLLLVLAGGLSVWLMNTPTEQHPVAQNPAESQASAAAGGNESPGGVPAHSDASAGAGTTNADPAQAGAAAHTDPSAANANDPAATGNPAVAGAASNPHAGGTANGTSPASGVNGTAGNSTSKAHDPSSGNANGTKRDNGNKGNTSNKGNASKGTASAGTQKQHTPGGAAQGKQASAGNGQPDPAGGDPAQANAANKGQVPAGAGITPATTGGKGADGSPSTTGDASAPGKNSNDPANSGPTTVTDTQGNADMSGKMKNTPNSNDPAASSDPAAASGGVKTEGDGGASVDVRSSKTDDMTQTTNDLFVTFNATKTMDALDQEEKDQKAKGSRNINSSNGYWFARGGVGYMPGFESSGSSGRSLNPCLAGGYSLGFGGRYRIEAGLQYTTIGHAADSSRIYSSINYSFGSDLSRTEIGLNRLHYAALPIHLRIGLNTNNAFLIGAEPHYLFAAESKVRTYTQHGNTIQDDKTKTVFGYQQGLRTFDMLLSAGYVRTINDHWEAMLLFNYGLLDVKNNEYFTFDKFERHKNLQVMLHYTF